MSPKMYTYVHSACTDTPDMCMHVHVTHIHVHAQVSTLVTLQLLSQQNSRDSLDSSKYKVCSLHPHRLTVDDFLMTISLRQLSASS